LFPPSFEDAIRSLNIEIKKEQTSLRAQIYHTDYSHFLHLFDSSQFRSYMSKNADGFARSGKTLRYMSQLMCLRRVKGQMHESPDGSLHPICGDVQAPQVKTFTLAMAYAQRRVYESNYFPLTGILYGGAGKASADPSTVKSRKQGVHRLLCHLTQNPMVYFLGAGFKSGNVMSTNDPVKAFNVFDRKSNHGLMGPSGSLLPQLRDRATAAAKIINFSPKHAALVTLINNICILKEQKLIVFENWPVSQFLTETLLGLLDIPYKSMRADHDSATREALVEEFNDPKDPDKIIVMSLKFVVV
jgi:hypothetical protein